LPIPKEDRSFLHLQKGESTCCFLLHGAGGSPKEMRLLGDHLFRLGLSVYAAGFTLGAATDGSNNIGNVISKFQWKNRGRETEKNSQVGNSWSVCLSESEIALNTLLSYTTNTYIVGFSFGATIALNLMLRCPVRGSILIAPALFPVRTVRYMVFQVLRKMLPLAARNIAAREYNILELMERTRGSLNPIHEPVLVIQASDDPVISSRGFHLLKRLSTHSKSGFHIIQSKNHVLVGGEESEKVLALCGDFIRET